MLQTFHRSPGQGNVSCVCIVMALSLSSSRLMAASTSLFLGVSTARAETGRPPSVLVVFLALFITIGLVGPESLSNILTF